MNGKNLQFEEGRYYKMTTSVVQAGKNLGIYNIEIFQREGILYAIFAPPDGRIPYCLPIDREKVCAMTGPVPLAYEGFGLVLPDDAPDVSGWLS
jgi:hypothetical protein